MPKTTLILSSDWQCSVTNLARCEKIVEQICEVLSNTPKPCYFIHAGDIKETTNPVDQRVTNFIIDAFQRIKRSCSGVAFVPGNHDYITTQDGVPSCVPVIEASGADWVANGKHEICCLNKDVALALVPYFRDPERQQVVLAEAAEEIKHLVQRFKVLVFHNEMEGCALSNYDAAKGHGLTPKDLHEIEYELLVSGHIHKPQVYQGVHYIGSPFTQDWGECNQQKRIMKVIYGVGQQGWEVTSIPSELPGWYDPEVPGYKPPKSWEGTRVRLTVPVSSNPTKDLEQARAKYAKQYPGASLHLVPSYQQQSLEPSARFDTSGGDVAVLESYLSKIQLPKYITAGQIVAYLQKFLPSLGLFGVQGLHFGEMHAWETLCFEELHFDWDRKGLTLLTGQNLDWGESISNGSGKSSFTTLPFLALFGRTFKNQTHDAWARQGAKHPSSVVQAIKLADNRQLVVRRGRKPGVLNVYLDGKNVTMGDPNKCQQFIEQLTNLTWSVLTNAVYIGQQEIGSVFGTDKERKELFSRLLGLDRFLDAHDKLRKVLNRVERVLTETATEQAAYESALSEAESGTAEIEKALEQAPAVDQKDLEQKQARLEEIRVTIRKNEFEREELQPTLDENQKQFEKLLFRVADIDAQIGTLRDQLDASKKVESKGECYVCGSKISLEKLEQYHKKLQSKIEELDAVAEEWTGKQNKNRTARKALLERVQKCDAENKELRREQSTLQQTVSSLEAMQDAHRRLTTILGTKQARVKDLTRKLFFQTAAYAATLEDKQFVETCIAVVGRDGLPAYLTAEVMPLLNQAAVTYSEIFTEGEIGLLFAEKAGDIDIQVINSHGGEGIKDQSRGEMRMAALIAALAFRDVLVKHNLLILDEPTDGLDPTNAAAFARGLNQIVDRFQHVVIISHNERLLAELEPNLHLEVTKQNRVSTLRTV